MEPVKRLRRDSDEHDGSDPETEGEGDEDLSGEDQPDSVSDSDSDIDPDMEFQVKVEARSIEAGDFHGIKRLLKQLFLKANVDLSGLTDLIISQSSHYGSTIKIVTEEEREDDDDKELEGQSSEEVEESDICGITTFIGLTPKQDHCFVQQLKDYLISQCKLHSTETNFKALSGILQKPVGLLINEKVLNLPEQIGALALRTLLKELNEDMATDSVCELVLIIARSHMVLSADTGQKRKRHAIPQKEEHVFDFSSENEFMLKESLLSFSYPVGEENDEAFGGNWSLDGTAVKSFRTVIILPYSKLEHAIIALEKALDEH